MEGPDRGVVESRWGPPVPVAGWLVGAAETEKRGRDRDQHLILPADMTDMVALRPSILPRTNA